MLRTVGVTSDNLYGLKDDLLSSSGADNLLSVVLVVFILLSSFSVFPMLLHVWASNARGEAFDSVVYKRNNENYYKQRKYI